MSDIQHLLTQTAQTLKSVSPNSAKPTSSAQPAAASYQVTVNPVTAGNEEQSMNYQQIMSHLHGMDPEALSEAADSFRALSAALAQARDQLKNAGSSLAENWSGAAAAKAMQRYQQLHDQTAQLAAQADTTANVMDWVGNEVMRPFKQIESPQVMGGGGVTGALEDSAELAAGVAPEVMRAGIDKANKAAREYMATLNRHLVEANQSLPASTAAPSANPANIDSTNWNGTNHSGLSSSTGSGNGGVGGSGGSAANPYASSTGAGHVSGGGSTGGALQGYGPTTGGSTVSPFGTSSPGSLSTGGGGANPFARMPKVPPVNTNPGNVPQEAPPKQFTKDVPDDNNITRTDPPTAADADGAASADGAAGSAGRSGESAMSAGGGGGEEKERQRQAWLGEDASIWGVPDEDIGPTIG